MQYFFVDPIFVESAMKNGNNDKIWIKSIKVFKWIIFYAYAPNCNLVMPSTIQSNMFTVLWMPHRVTRANILIALDWTNSIAFDCQPLCILLSLSYLRAISFHSICHSSFVIGYWSLIGLICVNFHIHFIRNLH